MSATAVEHGSGKGAADENFPVGSWLLPARLRPHVAAFYAFARAADDIADAPDLSPDDKISRLDRLEQALVDGSDDPALIKAERLRISLAQTDVTSRHPRDLLSAFRQDATQTRYPDWASLADYCARSAAPVGRYLLDLHGEDAALYPASDALCAVLQVLNHLQDCADDLRALDRCYLPLDRLAAYGAAVEDLTAPAASPALRAALTDIAHACDPWLAQARRLAPALRHRGLAAESHVIVGVAHSLHARLLRQDPLAERVKLSKAEVLGHAMRGLWALVAGVRG
jgi:squalene synthase HpnC